MRSSASGGSITRHTPQDLHRRSADGVYQLHHLVLALMAIAGSFAEESLSTSSSAVSNAFRRVSACATIRPWASMFSMICTGVRSSTLATAFGFTALRSNTCASMPAAFRFQFARCRPSGCHDAAAASHELGKRLTSVGPRPHLLLEA